MMALNVGELFASLACVDAGFSQGLAGAERALNNSAGRFTEIGKKMSLGVTMPLVGLTTLVVKTVSGFDDAMSEVSALGGATGETLDRLREKAKQMGAETTFSAKEAANGLKYMALAGWDADTSIKSLEPVLRLAEAGALDLGRTSDLVTDSMSALGLGSDDLQKYLDQTAMASARSNTNIDMLMQAMIESGGTIRNLNTPLDEANALFGVLANRGIKGSQAGNAFNSILMNLTTGAGQAGEAMEELGLSAFDSQGEFKGVTNVLTELRNKTSNMTDEQRNYYLAAIGGKTQLSTLQALLSGVGEEYGKLRGEVLDSEGALLEMASTMQDNLGGSIRNLMSALEGVFISFGEILVPIVKSAALFLTNLATKFTNLDDSVKMIILVLGALAAALGPALVAFGFMKTALVGISLATVGPIAGIVAVIAILVSLYFTSETFRDTVNKAFEAVREFVGEALTFLKDKATELWNFLKADFIPIWERFAVWAQEMIPIVKRVITEAFRLILDSIRLVWNIFQTFLLPVLRRFYEWIRPHIPLIQKIIQESFELIVRAIDLVVTAVRGLINWFSDLIDKAREFFGLSGGGGSNISGGSYSPRDLISYDVGTPRVPRDMIAMIHKDEMIVPAEYNPNNPSASRASRAGGGLIYEQTVIINSPKALSASENARKIKQSSRALALEWAVR